MRPPLGSPRPYHGLHLLYTPQSEGNISIKTQPAREKILDSEIFWYDQVWFWVACGLQREWVGRTKMGVSRNKKVHCFLQDHLALDPLAGDDGDFALETEIQVTARWKYI